MYYSCAIAGLFGFKEIARKEIIMRVVKMRPIVLRDIVREKEKERERETKALDFFQKALPKVRQSLIKA